MLAALWVLDLGLLASPGNSQERRPAKAGDARPAAPAPEKQFTIARIEPDAKNEEVRIFFSKPVPLEFLRGRLRLLPLVKLDWRQSAMSPEGQLTLKGKFKYGVGYVVNMPENFTVSGQTYAPTVTSFFMPDRRPRWSSSKTRASSNGTAGSCSMSGPRMSNPCCWKASGFHP